MTPMAMPVSASVDEPQSRICLLPEPLTALEEPAHLDPGGRDQRIASA